MSFEKGSDTAFCDTCGDPIGNGNVTLCIVLSGLDPDHPGLVHNWHFCHGNGCSEALFNEQTLAYYNQKKAEAVAEEQKDAAQNQGGDPGDDA